MWGLCDGGEGLALHGLTRAEQWIIGGTVAATLAFFAALMVTPAFWMRLGPMEVRDTRLGQPVPIQYDREFRRDFLGSWVVAIWRQNRGEWMAWCAAEGSWPYKASIPATDVDLEWLVSGDVRCSHLPPGQYRIEVAVTANPGTLISRTETVMSNAFEVRP